MSKRNEKTAVRIYLADTTPLMDSALFDRLYAGVSRKRQEQISRFRFQKDRCLSLAAECLLRRACGDFHLEYDRLRVARPEGEKPHFADAPVSFNLSHSGHWALCAMSSMEVGCDVEQPREDSMKLARRFFAPSETRALESLPTEAEQRLLFCRLWTLKESFMKCVGMGFRLPLNAFSIDTDSGVAQVAQHVDEGPYHFFEKDTGDGFHCALCVRGEGARVEWEIVTL